MQTRRPTYYDLLGLKRSATLDDIKQAYREIARVYHPDSNFFKEIIDEPITDDQDSRFKEINEAYEILSDEERRSIYDSTLPPELNDWESASDSEGFIHALRYKKQYRFCDQNKETVEAKGRPRQPTFGSLSEVVSKAKQEQDVTPIPSIAEQFTNRPLPKVKSRTKEVLFVVIGGLLLGLWGAILASFLF